MTPPFPINSFFRALTRRSRQAGVQHPDAVSEARLNLPRRIDDPVVAAAIASDLLRHRREDITLALYLDDRHRFVGHCIVAVGWVQTARLSARPILFGAQVCRATSCILVRYHRWERLSASEAERSSYRSIAQAAARHGLVILDHLVVTPSGGSLDEHRALSDPFSPSMTGESSDAGSDAWGPLLSTCLAWTGRGSAPWCHRPWCSP